MFAGRRGAAVAFTRLRSWVRVPQRPLCDVSGFLGQVNPQTISLTSSLKVDRWAGIAVWVHHLPWISQRPR